MKLSAVVLTKNEEQNITACLKSLAWCTEIIVVDDASTDKTVALAKKLGAKIFKHTLNGDFAAQRNFGLECAKYDWVLFVDADEAVSKPLAKEIQRVIEDTDCVGFFIPRRDVWMGRTLEFGESRVELLRLARKTRAWRRAVHETWEVEGEVGRLVNHLLHRPHPSLEDFVAHITKYSQMHAGENQREGKTAKLWKIVFYPIGKFIWGFIMRQGFRDGMHGLIYATVMSFHSFLAWSQLWLKQNNYH